MKARDRLLQDQLREALAHAGGTHTLSDVADSVRVGDAQIWQHGRTIALTELVHYPQLQALRIWLVAGSLEDCDQLVPEIESYARESGCSRVEAIGRDGWARYGAALGYRPVATVFRKELHA